MEIPAENLWPWMIVTGKRYGTFGKRNYENIPDNLCCRWRAVVSTGGRLQYHLFRVDALI